LSHGSSLEAVLGVREWPTFEGEILCPFFVTFAEQSVSKCAVKFRLTYHHCLVVWKCLELCGEIQAYLLSVFMFLVA